MQIKKRLTAKSAEPMKVEKAMSVESESVGMEKAELGSSKGLGITAISQLKSLKKGASANVSPFSVKSESAKEVAEVEQPSAINQAREKYKAKLKQRVK